MQEEMSYMKVVDTSFKRSSYQVELYNSLLFESALGIAAATYPKLHAALDKPQSYWQHLRTSTSLELRRELDFCQRQQTWKMLLQLLHAQNFATAEDFFYIYSGFRRQGFQLSDPPVFRELPREQSASSSPRGFGSCTKHDSGL